ncbi:competence protein CoiA family protein [Streptomyces sp. NPDC059445]|uniref:competence protein CoiA n=1 Tax=Streptomyces sp. NPDC059445 TaxID=3346832 RepID=UPI0036823D15
MGYTAVHPQWGRIDASLEDLGCGRAWSDVHRVTGMELTCPQCQGRVFARISQHRLPHFYHQVRPPDCELANESAAHHLLKLELATAARAAGWRAELEVSSPSRDWRADVLVYDDRGRPFMALEAQLSAMTPDEARLRTDRYAPDGLAVCWIDLQQRPWQRAVPSLLVRCPTERGETWTVWHGVKRYDWTPRTLKARARWTDVICPLGEAVGWILSKRIQTYSSAKGLVWWTAPAYAQLSVERARVEAEAESIARSIAAGRLRQQAERHARAAERRLRDSIESAAAIEQERQAELLRLEGFFQYAGVDATVWEAFTQMVRSASGKAVFYGEQSPAHGNGLLVYAGPRWGKERRLAGVVCPDPAALARWPRDLTILVPNQTWLARIQAAAQSSLKVAVLNPVTRRSAFVRVP